MSYTQGRCMNCMKEIGSLQEVCPHCGFKLGESQKSPFLPLASTVGGRYTVGTVKEYNGEGATYIAWDHNSNTSVSIREFLPLAIISREAASPKVLIMRGNEQTYTETFRAFSNLWRALSRFRGLSAIPNVLDIFEENGTMYVVTDCINAVSMKKALQKSSTGTLNWDRAKQLFMPVISTLSQLHAAGIVHGGISTQTLMLCVDGKIRLSGFAIGHIRKAGGDLTPELFDGYAAIEQYDPSGKIGPWTDIYAFSAVIYRTLVGSEPIDAPSRMRNDQLMIPGKIAEQIPAYVINAMINALQIAPEDRTSSVEKFRNDLSASPTAAVAATNTNIHEPVRKDKSSSGLSFWSNLGKREKKTFLSIAGATLAVGLVLFLAIWGIAGRGDRNPDKSTTNPDSTVAAEMVNVPDFAQFGTYLTVISNPIWKETFQFEIVEEYSSSHSGGTIIGQSVRAGESVEKGSKIILTVSKGKEMAELPLTLVGMNYDEAKALLSDLGFSVEKRDDSNDGSKTAGQVSAVIPVAGKKYEKGTTVVLRVWGEPGSSKATTNPPATSKPTQAPTTTIKPTQPPSSSTEVQTTQPEETTATPTNAPTSSEDQAQDADD